MPCYDGREDEDNRRNYQLCAVLCGLITKNGLGILDNLDWKEIGVNKKIVLDWWDLHVKEDERRKRRERQEASQNKLRKSAEFKLTKEELNAILRKR